MIREEAAECDHEIAEEEVLTESEPEEANSSGGEGAAATVTKGDFCIVDGMEEFKGIACQASQLKGKRWEVLLVPHRTKALLAAENMVLRAESLLLVEFGVLILLLLTRFQEAKAYLRRLLPPERQRQIHAGILGVSLSPFESQSWRPAR